MRGERYLLLLPASRGILFESNPSRGPFADYHCLESALFDTSLFNAHEREYVQGRIGTHAGSNMSRAPDTDHTRTTRGPQQQRLCRQNSLYAA